MGFGVNNPSLKGSPGSGWGEGSRIWAPGRSEGLDPKNPAARPLSPNGWTFPPRVHERPKYLLGPGSLALLNPFQCIEKGRKKEGVGQDEGAREGLSSDSDRCCMGAWPGLAESSGPFSNQMEERFCDRCQQREIKARLARWHLPEGVLPTWIFQGGAF